MKTVQVKKVIEDKKIMRPGLELKGSFKGHIEAASLLFLLYQILMPGILWRTNQ